MTHKLTKVSTAVALALLLGGGTLLAGGGPYHIKQRDKRLNDWAQAPTVLEQAGAFKNPRHISKKRSLIDAALELGGRLQLPGPGFQPRHICRCEIDSTWLELDRTVRPRKPRRVDLDGR